jgi:hypothetical protein
MSVNEAVWFSILTGAAVKSTAVLALACLAALEISSRLDLEHKSIRSSHIFHSYRGPVIDHGFPVLKTAVPLGVVPCAPM